jgi:hypothetical protein
VEWIEKAIGEDVERGQLTKGASLWGFPAFPTKEQPAHKAIKRSRRMVVDYRGLNKVTLRRYFIIPNADALKSTVAGSKYISVGDLKEGFNQVDNEPETAQKMAVLAASGSYLPRGLTFGPTNGPEDFQELVFMIFGKKLYTEWFLFLDDLTIATGRPKSLPPGPSGAADVTESNLTFSVTASMECEARVTPLGTRLRCTIAETPGVTAPRLGVTPGGEPNSAGVVPRDSAIRKAVAEPWTVPAPPANRPYRSLLVIPQTGKEEAGPASSTESSDQKVRRTISRIGPIPMAARLGRVSSV